LFLGCSSDKEIQLPEPEFDLFGKNMSERERRRRTAERIVAEIKWPSPAEIVEDIKCEYAINDITLDHLHQEGFRKAFKKAYRFDLEELLVSNF
jgi:hypothetical protein